MYFASPMLMLRGGGLADDLVLPEDDTFTKYEYSCAPKICRARSLDSAEETAVRLKI